MQNELNTDQLKELIKSAQMGSVNAFRSIVKIHQQYVYAVAFKILCHEENSQDIVQESFVRVWKHLRDYDSNVKFTTWLYKIVINLCYDKLRTIKRYNEIIETSIDDLDLLADDDNYETKSSNKEMAELIAKVANNLSDKQKIVFVLRDLEQFSINEVAEITGMKESSIKTNLVYARRNIKEKLIMMVK